MGENFRRHIEARRLAEDIHFEADNTVVTQNNDQRVDLCVSVSAMRILSFALVEFLRQHYTFDALIGNRLPGNQFGPVRTCRVICSTGQRESLIPVGLLREMIWSYAGPNQRIRPGMTGYLVNASLTPISIGFDAWTVPESNKIEIRYAEVSLDMDMNSITMGSQDLNRLGFFILPEDGNGPGTFGFEIEELEEDEAHAEEREDESETETEDSSDEDL